MSKLTRWMDRNWYGAYPDRWDDLLLRSEILKFVRPEDVVLDLGAGAGVVPEMNFLDKAGRVCGLDPDERVRENPFLHEASVGSGEKLPYPPATFDLVFADNVLEHLARPKAVFAEVARVLKPGGVFITKTPGRFHYVTLATSLTGHGFHQFVNRLRGRAAVDTFPTLYRANSPGSIRRLASGAGLSVVKCDMIEGRPEYLRLSAAAYVIGFVYERWVNRVPGFARFRVIILAVLKKGA
ncbi:MAG TPA: class I SAM-dependent methyltransferase [Armatimonadota bacterium]|nr:class I SAM-dependent methyltransferase [Armatimonadota bacterium]